MKTSQDSIAFGYRGSAMTIIETNVPLPDQAAKEELFAAYEESISISDALIARHEALIRAQADMNSFLIERHNKVLAEAAQYAKESGRADKAGLLMGMKLGEIE